MAALDDNTIDSSTVIEVLSLLLSRADGDESAIISLNTMNSVRVGPGSFSLLDDKVVLEARSWTTKSVWAVDYSVISGGSVDFTSIFLVIILWLLTTWGASSDSAPNFFEESEDCGNYVVYKLNLKVVNFSIGSVSDGGGWTEVSLNVFKSKHWLVRSNEANENCNCVGQFHF